MRFATSAVGGGLDGFEAAEAIVELSSGAWILKNSRDQERHADTRAVQKLQRAGRSVQGLMEFFSAIQEELGDIPESIQWISTHPLHAERIQRVESLTLDENPGHPWMSPEEWEAFRGRF